jgi:aminomethyltransferase
VSQNWRIWSGYWAASSYGVVHDYEYHAIRNSAGLIDVSPLYKYDVRGRDATKLVNRVITRDASKCTVGQALYACLCENDGAVIQDGTVFRLAEDRFRFHLAEPALRWLKLNALGMDVSVEEVSSRIAALALQGPTAFNTLSPLVDFELGRMRFFRFAQGRLAGMPVIVSRTGYTGDLGYEIWVDAEQAERLWDVLLEQGSGFGIKPAGLLALDVARLEAGFILLEVDYTSAEKALIPSQRYSPLEIGLGWTVDLKKPDFVGAAALRRLKDDGVLRQIVGIEIALGEYEALFARAGLPPEFPTAAWRGSAPLYRDDRQVGQATTGAWSPVLKKYIALATVESDYAVPETRLAMEVTVDHKRKTTGAKVVKLPFFDPPRKRALFEPAQA